MPLRRRLPAHAARLGVLLTVLALCAPSQASEVDPAAGPALVAASAERIAELRPAAETTPAWRFDFALSGSGDNPSEKEVPLSIVVTEAGYALVQTLGTTEIYDYRVGRHFSLDTDGKSFRNSSLYAMPYFRVYEWVHRKRTSAIMAKLVTEPLPPSMISDFWRSQDLGIRPPQEAPSGIAITRDGGRLNVAQDGVEAIAMTALADPLPDGVAARLWDALTQVQPLHPDFVAHARAEKLAPARLAIRHLGQPKDRTVVVNLLSHAAVEQRYPLDAGFTALPPHPSPPGNPQAAELVTVAWQAAQGDFAGKQPDTAFWQGLLIRARDSGGWLQPFLAFAALRNFTGSADPGCDGAAGLDAATLCPLVRQLADLKRFEAEAVPVLQMVGATDQAGRLAAVEKLPGYRDAAGELAPILDLFIANQIEGLTRTVTRSGGNFPDRHDAISLYASALKSFPFIRQTYGDLSFYYFYYFDMELGFVFADAGRALPVQGGMLKGSNLEAVGRIEQRLRKEFPTAF